MTTTAVFPGTLRASWTLPQSWQNRKVIRSLKEQEDLWMKKSSKSQDPEATMSPTLAQFSCQPYLTVLWTNKIHRSGLRNEVRRLEVRFSKIPETGLGLHGCEVMEGLLFPMIGRIRRTMLSNRRGRMLKGVRSVCVMLGGKRGDRRGGMFTPLGSDQNPFLAY